MRTSLKDIALKLKLSKTTISWTLSGQGDKKGISRKTQELILACAKEMNYRPNLLARSLNTGFSGILGLIIPDITDSFYGQMAYQIEQQAEAHGYNLMICNSLFQMERENKMLEVFQAKQVDGAIIAPTARNAEHIKPFLQEKYPIVTFDQKLSHIDVSRVLVDNREATQHIITRMIQQGAKHVALISANAEQYTIRERRQGYLQALSEAGVTVDPTLIIDIPSLNVVNQAMEQLMQLHPDVDAMFFTSHIVALEAFRFFQSHGIQTQGHIALGSMHDIPAFQAFAPHIMVARMPVQDIARTTVDLLIQQIQNRRQNQQVKTQEVILPCTFEG